MEILKKKIPVEPRPPKASSQQQQTYPATLQKIKGYSSSLPEP